MSRQPLGVIGQEPGDDVCLAAEQRAHARGGIAHDAQHHALHVEAPVPVIRVGREDAPVPLYPRHEAQRSCPYGSLVEDRESDAVDVPPGDDLTAVREFRRNQ